MNKLRSVLLPLALMLCCSSAFAQTAIIFEVSEGRYVGIVTTPTGQQFALTSIVITKLKVVPDKPPVTPVSRVDRCTYYYEKDDTVIPKPVAFALQRLNDEYKDIVASEFEDDTLTGNDTVPKAYAAGLEAARKAGLPALVVESNGKVVDVIKNPKTVADVFKAVGISESAAGSKP